MSEVGVDRCPRREWCEGPVGHRGWCKKPGGAKRQAGKVKRGSGRVAAGRRNESDAVHDLSRIIILLEERVMASLSEVLAAQQETLSKVNEVAAAVASAPKPEPGAATAAELDQVVAGEVAVQGAVDGLRAQLGV